MAKKITIYDVAKDAGVAISTVSRVLNGSPYVSEETKNKVQAAIDKLDFHPQVSARMLAKRQPQIIAVAVPTFTTPFFNEVLKGVKDEISKLDLDFIIYNTGSEDPEENFKRFVDRGIPDGLIVFSIDITEKVNKRLKDYDIPVILVGSNHPEYDYFYWDNYKGGYTAGKHLAQNGYRKIGFIRSHTKSSISDERERGFRDALAENGISLNDDMLVSGITRKHAGFSEEAGYEAIKILKERDAIPEALFCSNDAQAIGAIHALGEMGLSVPEDVAILGYDNIKISKYLNLSTMDQAMYDVGIRAIQRLSERYKDNNIKLKQTVIEPELIVRKSTKPKS
ncbi:transcriptional regulator, LacI family [Cyclonatronum proteinivorum]|uniref:Transcriptional regulator, LacI family n=1 Tax=Cyclonatronum proteinivorum TaxID=1457365 RepID=A0A345ULJ7_9BACT|nr:LacI family DNA-binding transcriptional regulator [Cyclonatronum proteinivorum]AXJ01349.1 transcriptional regulator, LacI family [Cyclonatronum proteinivorum]